MLIRRPLSRALAALLFFVAPFTALSAQAAEDAWFASRGDLLAQVEQTRSLASSPAYGTRVRERASVRLQALERRLSEGDFRSGDRFLIRVSGLVEVLDTVTVMEGQRAFIPQFGEVALRGVLRSELQAKMQAHVVASVRDAVVDVRPMMRIAVFGNVGSPGYLVVTSETRIDEVLALAGGPSPDADPLRLRMMRGPTVILEPDAVRNAIASGQTIRTLALQEGDYLSVEARRPRWDRASSLQLLSVVGAPLITFFLLR